MLLKPFDISVFCTIIVKFKNWWNFSGIMEKAYTLWFTGLHGSGKSTIASRMLEKLRGKNIKAILLDGDELRKVLSSDLRYTLKERNEHMRRAAEYCRQLSSKGILTIACVASPTEESRSYAKQIIKKFFLVYVRCPLKICEERDVKGHYKKAREKQAGFENFVGVSLNFEEPKNPDIILDTDKESIEGSVNKLLEKLKERSITSL